MTRALCASRARTFFLRLVYTLMAKYMRPYYRGRGRLGTGMRYHPPAVRRIGRGYRRRPRNYLQIRRPIRSANRLVSTLHRIEQYNGGSDQYEIFLVSGPLDVPKHIAPLVSQFPGTGPYKALYHQFRVTKIMVEFFPVNSQARYQDGTEEDFCQLYTPTLYTSINRTSSNFADNITKMCSTNSMRSVTAGRYHKRVFTPCTLDQTYESAVTTGYNPEFGQWISTEDTAVPHFGLDVLLSSTSSPKCSFKYKMRTTIYVQWKNRKPNVDLS